MASNNSGNTKGEVYGDPYFPPPPNISYSNNDDDDEVFQDMAFPPEPSPITNGDSDPIFIDEQDNDSNDPTIAFKLQHDITFDKISSNEIPALRKKEFYTRISQFIYIPGSNPPQVDPEIAAHFTQFLLHRDISKYNPHATEVTAFQAAIIKRQLPPAHRIIVQFIEARRDWLIQGKDQLHRGEHPSTVIFEEYEKFIQKIHHAERDRSVLGILFREFFTVRVQKKDGKVIKWFKLQEGLNLEILK